MLIASQLSKSFKGLLAVDRVDLKLDQGECLALLGPNGAGKTTIVEMLLGLVPPDKGSIHILGYAIPDERKKALEKIGVLLQETSLYKRFTVLETLNLFASFYRETRDPIEILQKLGIVEKAKVELRKLSGGQRQSVYIACALLHKPSVLFLDEPTTGLDPQARRRIWDLLLEFKKDGGSLFLTTHFMDEAALLADKVVMMDRGRVLAQGSPEELIRNLVGKQTLWVEFAQGADDQQKLVPILPWLKMACPQGKGFGVLVPDIFEATQALLLAAKKTAVTINGLSWQEGSLEDLFLQRHRFLSPDH